MIPFVENQLSASLICLSPTIHSSLKGNATPTHSDVYLLAMDRSLAFGPFNNNFPFNKYIYIYK